MMEKANFKKALGGVLKSGGFTNKGQSWYLDGRDSIVVLNLQKSDFDEKYYVNLGVWLKSLDAVPFPSENKCHIQARLTALFPEHAEIIDLACRIGSSSDEFAKFAEFLQVIAMPFCHGCLRAEDLRSKIEAGDFKRALVMKIVKDALNRH